MKPQRTEGSWVWGTQEKGRKNIPGGWDSMNKGRDAENKGDFGETSNQCCGWRTREEESGENTLQRHNEADFLAWED